MGIFLIATHPDNEARRFELVSEANIGRGPSCHLVLPSDHISRLHARIVRRDERLILLDTQSENGTLVNGRRIDAPTILVDTDVVMIGDWTLTFDRVPAEILPPFAGRTPREHELVAALAKTPHDDELRQVYGDWLEENGFATEAEVLALEREIAGGAAANRLGYRLRLLSASTGLAWRAGVTRPSIEACDRASCPKTWDLLELTDDAAVRRCATCTKSVYFADSIVAARKQIARGRAVVIDVAVERYLRDLGGPAPELVLATPPAPDPTATHELPFFARREPPATVGHVLASLGIALPADLGDGNDMGHLLMPGMHEVEADPLTPFVSRLVIEYDWDVFHEERPASFERVATKGYQSLSLAFQSGAARIGAWLEGHFGAAREVLSTPVYEGHLGTNYRVYNDKWMTAPDGADDSFVLRWESKLPEWALPKTDPAAALSFLRELAAVLRNDASYDAVKDFASRPPPHAGVKVGGPLNREDFWLELEPRLPALDVTAALDIEEPIGSSSDFHMQSWKVYSLAGEERSSPTYGPWILELSLEHRPSGEKVSFGYSSYRLTAESRIEHIRIARPSR